MEINYELIIKYLVKKNKNIANNFTTQKHIYNYATEFPEKFKKLLTDKFYRYGITIYDNENNNISFWSSILTIIDKNFIVPYSADESELIHQFKNQLLEKYAKSQLSSFLKDLDKNDFRERFKLDPTIYTLQYLVDILDINILIFDFETENISTVYKKNIMNPWKKIILLAKYNNYWEPIMCVKSKGDIERLFDYNDNIIKKIITTPDLINYFESDIIKKYYTYTDDINNIIQEEKTKIIEPEIKKSITPITPINDKLIEDSNESTVNTDDTSIFINKNELEEFKKLNKTKLKNMKVDELKKLIEKLQITLTTNKPNKTILIESILAKIN